MAQESAATAVALENVILKGLEDCSRIICLENGKPFARGKRKEDGKTYSQFRLGSIVFNVPDDSPFVADQKAGNLAKVELRSVLIDKDSLDEKGNQITIQVPGLEFDYHLSKAQMNSFKDQTIFDEEFESKLASIKFKKEAFANLAAKPITDEFLAQLLNNL